MTIPENLKLTTFWHFKINILALKMFSVVPKPYCLAPKLKLKRSKLHKIKDLSN